MLNRKQPTGNNGVWIGGNASGNSIQNQPGAVGSTMHTSPPTGDEEKLQQLEEKLQELQTRLTGHERSAISSPDECEALLGTIRRELQTPEGRPGALTLLRTLEDRCAGAAGITSLLTSVINLASTLS